MKLTLTHLLLVLGVLSGAAGPAGAATLTFDIVGIPVTLASYSEGGFDFTADPGPLLSWGTTTDSADPSPTSSTISANNLSAKVKMVASGGAPFDLAGMDIADSFDLGFLDNVDFLFTFADTSTLASSVTLNNTPGLQHFDFNLANLISVEWTSTNGGPPQIDNVVVSAVPAVPIPPALPLFASAFASLGFFGWRRRKGALDRGAGGV
jgi:hypothetical protein